MGSGMEETYQLTSALKYLKWGKEVALMHLHAVMPTVDQGVQFVRSLKENQIVRTLPREIRKILLNFGNVEFLSSAALGKLITMNRKVQAVRGKLVLCNISKEIREVFEITKLDKLFTILPDEQSALQAF